MMLKFLSIKELIIKLLVVGLILLTFAFNISYYLKNEEEIRHYKPYYAMSSLYAAEHKISFVNAGANAQNDIEGSKSLPVLVYHGILEKPDGVSLGLSDFKNQMFALKEKGYNTIRINDFYQFIEGKKNLPDKSFLLTFDDGRKDSYYPVDPILKELNYSAVMFLITDTLKDKTNGFHLIKDEVDKMITTGRWDIEAHTFSGHGLIQIDKNGTMGHFFSNKMWIKSLNRLETDEEYRRRITEDLKLAREDIKKYFNLDAVGFAFPFGDYGLETQNYPDATRVLKEISKSIYPLDFYQVDESKGFSFNLFNKKDSMIKRINVDATSQTSVVDLVEWGHEKSIPYLVSSFNQNQGWIKTWGSCKFDDGRLVLNSNEEATGAVVFLDGTSTLKDYKMKIRVNWDKGETFSILLKYKNDANYTSLELRQKSVALVEKKENVDRVIATNPITFDFDKSKFDFEMVLDGTNLTGKINENTVVSGRVLADAEMGGIGFKAWDGAPDNARVLINSMEVIDDKANHN